MKSAVIGVLAVAFLLTFGLALTAWGGETPGAPAPKAEPKVVDKSEKLAAPIKAQMAAAEKLLQQSSEEMAKPEGKRDFKKADGFKATAGNTYIAAAIAAVRAAATLKGEEKTAFLSQYDAPNRETAIKIFLELGDAAKATRKWQEATGYYNKVLQIDPKNEAATAGIKAVQDGMKTGDHSKDNKKHY